MDPALSPIHNAHPPNIKDYWPVHHYTVSEAPDLLPSLIWYSLFSSSSSPTDKQKWWGTYCWLAPCVIERLYLFFPSVSSSSPTAFSFVAVVLELSRQQSTDAQLSCPGTTKDQLPAPWQLKLFWETRIRTDHEFTRHNSSNQRNLGKRVCKHTALSQLLSLDPKIQSGIVLVIELHAHYVSSAQQKLYSIFKPLALWIYIK